MSSPSPVSGVIDCEQIVTVCTNRQPFLAGADQDKVASIERRADGQGCSIVFDGAGTILAVGHTDQVLSQLGLADFAALETVVDGRGCSLIPGLVDAHTHPVWAGDRVNEFDLKLRGASYLEIHNQGGGIHYTVEQTRKASEQTLLDTFLERLQLMVSCGTTVVECKSGYGLDFASERKMLEVIARGRQHARCELVSTFLGAHAVPKSMTAEEGVMNVIDIMQRLAPLNQQLRIEFIDVFCEKNVYDPRQTQRMLAEGCRLLAPAAPAFHGDELCDFGSASLAAQIGARSLAHMEYSNAAGIAAMARAQVAAILCPTTCYLLRLPKPDVRGMINAGVPVVVATDFNPNAMCYSLPMAMNLAAVHYGMTLNECLVASTINAAYALKREKQFGSLEPGKRGDCVLVRAADWRHLIYEFGNTRDLIKTVLMCGVPVGGHGKQSNV